MGESSSISSRIETKLYDSNESSGSGDGWFDDYDDFVDKLDFEGGGWDSGADSPFDGDGRSSDSYSSRGGGGRGRGRGGGGRGRGMTWDRDFGRNSNGHDYIRDTSRDTTPVDETAVNRLLSDRLHYRKKRMFDAADDMRDELLNVHGVTVWDKDRTWTTGRGGADTRGGRGGGRGTYNFVLRYKKCAHMMCTKSHLLIHLQTNTLHTLFSFKYI